MKKLMSICLAAALLCLLAGCAASSSRVVKTGFVGSETSRAWSGRFKSYNGYESKVVTISKEADTLRVTYSVAAEAGTLRFTLEEAGGLVLFDSKEAETPEGMVERLGQGGEKYILRITGEAAQNGSFALAWEFLNN